jgi:hypothetical protein
MVHHHDMTRELVVEHHRQVERAAAADRLARLARRVRRNGRAATPPSGRRSQVA